MQTTTQEIRTTAQTTASIAQTQGISPVRRHFEQFLTECKAMMDDHKTEIQQPRCFISYAWEQDAQKNERLQKRLQLLKDDLQKLGAIVQLDIRNIESNLTDFMQKGIETSDYIFLIGAPRLKERLAETGSVPNNAQYEFEEIKQKWANKPNCLLPLLMDGDFGTAFPKEAMRNLIRDCRQNESEWDNPAAMDAYLKTLSAVVNPLGIIPVIYGLSTHSNPRIFARYQSVCEHLEAQMELLKWRYKHGSLSTVQTPPKTLSLEQAKQHVQAKFPQATVEIITQFCQYFNTSDQALQAALDDVAKKNQTIDTYCTGYRSRNAMEKYLSALDRIPPDQNERFVAEWQSLADFIDRDPAKRTTIPTMKENLTALTNYLPRLNRALVNTQASHAIVMQCYHPFLNHPQNGMTERWVKQLTRIARDYGQAGFYANAKLIAVEALAFYERQQIKPPLEALYSLAALCVLTHNTGEAMLFVAYANTLASNPEEKAQCKQWMCLIENNGIVDLITQNQLITRHVLTVNAKAPDDQLLPLAQTLEKTGNRLWEQAYAKQACRLEIISNKNFSTLHNQTTHALCNSPIRGKQGRYWELYRRENDAWHRMDIQDINDLPDLLANQPATNLMHDEASQQAIADKIALHEGSIPALAAHCYAQAKTCYEGVIQFATAFPSQALCALETDVTVYLQDMHVGYFPKDNETCLQRLYYPLMPVWETIQQSLKPLREPISTTVEKLDVLPPWQTTSSTLKDTFKMLLGLGESLLGASPLPYAVMGIGSLARDEACPYSDLEFIFVIQTSDESIPKNKAKQLQQETKRYLKALMQWMELQLIALGETQQVAVWSRSINTKLTIPMKAGFRLDEGGNVPCSGKDPDSYLVGTADDLITMHCRVLGDGMPEDLIITNALQGAAYLSGDQACAKYFRERLIDYLQQNQLNQRLATALLREHLNNPEFNSVIDENTPELNIKKGFLRLPMLMTEMLALYFGIDKTSTEARLNALVQAKQISPQMVEGLACCIAFGLRMRDSAHRFYQQEEDTVYWGTETQMPDRYYLLTHKEDAPYQLQEAYCLLMLHKLVILPTKALIEKALLSPSASVLSFWSNPSQEMLKSIEAYETALAEHANWAEALREHALRLRSYGRFTEAKCLSNWSLLLHKKENPAPKQPDAEFNELNADAQYAVFLNALLPLQAQFETTQDANPRALTLDQLMHCPEPDGRRASTLYKRRRWQAMMSAITEPLNEARMAERGKTGAGYHTLEGLHTGKRLLHPEFSRQLEEGLSAIYHISLLSNLQGTPKPQTLYLGLKSDCLIECAIMDKHGRLHRDILSKDILEPMGARFPTENTLEAFKKIKAAVLLETAKRGHTNASEHAVSYGTHPIVKVNVNGYSLYLKYFPEYPGIEAATNRLLERVIGGFVQESELCRISHSSSPDHFIPVLVMKAVPEGTIKEHYRIKASNTLPRHDLPKKQKTVERLTKIDEDTFSRLVVGGLLTTPEDAKTDNLVLHDRCALDDEEQRLLKWKDGQLLPLPILTHLDNDRSFLPSVVKKGNALELQMKHFVFCMDQMQEPLSKTVKQELGRFNFYTLLNGWIEELEDENRRCLRVFKHQEQIAHFQFFGQQNSAWNFLRMSVPTEEDTPCTLILPVVFVNGAEERLLGILQGLKALWQKYPDIDHKTLLHRLEPQAFKSYQPILEENKGNAQAATSLSRWKLIEEKYYHIGSYGETISGIQGMTIQMQTLQIATQKNLAELLAGDHGSCYAPGLSKHPGINPMKLQKIQEELKNGQTSLFTRIMNAELRKQILAQAPFKHIPIETQQTMFRTAQDICFTYLIIHNADGLTDDLLLGMLKSSGEYLVEVQLAHCTNAYLTGALLSNLAQYCPNLESVSLIGLSQLKQLPMPGWLSGTPILPNLKRLEIHGCDQLEKMELEIPAIRELKVENNPKLDSIVFNKAATQTFLMTVVGGRSDEMETLLKETPWLALAHGRITDPTNRTFKEISGFQYAVWAHDRWLVDKLLAYLPQEEAAKQFRRLEEKPETISSHGAQFSFEPLINRYTNYIDNWSDSFKDVNRWGAVGNEQANVPQWYMYKFLENGKNVAWVKQNPQMGFERKNNKQISSWRVNASQTGSGWVRGRSAGVNDVVQHWALGNGSGILLRRGPMQETTNLWGQLYREDNGVAHDKEMTILEKTAAETYRQNLRTKLGIASLQVPESSERRQVVEAIHENEELLTTRRDEPLNEDESSATTPVPYGYNRFMTRLQS